MSVLFPLTTRLRLARLALVASPESVEAAELASLLHSGVDLLVLGDSGDAERDAATLREFRHRWGTAQLLLATANPQAGALGSADVVYLPTAGEPQRPHEYSLLGCGVADAEAFGQMSQDLDFVFLDGDGAGLLDAALTKQPAYRRDSTPWFARTRPEAASSLIATGARRLALDGAEVLALADPAAEVKRISAELRQVWREEPEAFGYVTGALRS